MWWFAFDFASVENDLGSSIFDSSWLRSISSVKALILTKQKIVSLRLEIMRDDSSLKGVLSKYSASWCSVHDELMNPLRFGFIFGQALHD